MYSGHPRHVSSAGSRPFNTHEAAGERWGELLSNRQHRHKRLLRDLDRAHPLHALLPLGLLLEQLALAADVAAIALGQNVLAHRADRLASDDLAAVSVLDRYFEELARDQLAQLL